jgi:hypothetical protein
VRNGIRSIRPWKLPNAEAANPAPPGVGAKLSSISRQCLLPQRTTDSPRIISLRPIPICIASRLERDHSLHKVGIGPVGARPFDKRELPP